MSWQGPYRVGDYITNIFTDTLMRPPKSAGVYVLSENSWIQFPGASARPLYVGRSGPDSQEHLRSRLGDLFSDMFGFTDDDPLGQGGRKFCYRHPGGNRLWHWCLRHRSPNDLYVGWHSECSCGICAELRLIEMLKPSLNNQIPRNCRKHRSVLEIGTNCI
jgi:hypothetical protein